MTSSNSPDSEPSPSDRVDGLDPQFAVENRINLCLNVLSDIHTEWGYVRIDNKNPEELHDKAEHLEEYAADLQAAADKYEESEYCNDGSTTQP